MKTSGFRKQTAQEIKEKQDKTTARRIASLKAKQASRVIKPKANKKPAKRTTGPKKRKSRTERQQLETKIWEECKRITRSRYGDKCYTCSAEGLEGSNQHTGHGKPKGALPLQFKYDIRNLRVQCYNDNINLGGASDIFIAKLEQEEEGLAFLKEACRQTEGGWIIKKENGLVGKEATLFLRELLEQYKGIT